MTSVSSYKNLDLRQYKSNSPCQRAAGHRNMAALAAVATKVRATLIFSWIVLTGFTGLPFFVFPVTLLLRLLGFVHYAQLYVGGIAGHWWSCFVFLIEKVNRTKIIFYGDLPTAHENALVLANHRTELDWMFLWCLAYRTDTLRCFKNVIKAEAKWVPIFGTCFFFLEFLFLERSWDRDAGNIARHLRRLHAQKCPLWLVLFPEGTDYDADKLAKSQKFAAERGLPILQHVLLPKSRGFVALMEGLADHMAAVYDITVAYKQRPPGLMDVLTGRGPAEVHIRIRRHPVAQVPHRGVKEEGDRWLLDSFQQKEQTLEAFYQTGDLGKAKLLPVSAVPPIHGLALAVKTFGFVIMAAVIISLLWQSFWVRIFFVSSTLISWGCGVFNYLPS
eukprot:jgi/Mesvir1/23717/Mv18664-RA.1